MVLSSGKVAVVDGRPTLCGDGWGGRVCVLCCCPGRLLAQLQRVHGLCVTTCGAGVVPAGWGAGSSFATVASPLSLLSPAPLQIIFHGPREGVLPFFEGLGFVCPERKGVAEFLQEVPTLAGALWDRGKDSMPPTTRCTRSVCSSAAGICYANGLC